MNRTHSLKKIKSFVIKAAIFQIILAVIIVSLLRGTIPPPEDTMKQVTGVVESTSYWNPWGIHQFIVYIESEKYSFFRFSDRAELGFYDLYQMIEVGDEITLTYTCDFGILPHNVVIVADTKQISYGSLTAFYADQQASTVIAVVLCVVLEVVFLFILFLWIMLNKKRLSIRKNNKEA